MIATAAGLILATGCGALAAVFVAARRVCRDEGWNGAARRCALLAAGFLALAVLGAASVAFAHDPYTGWRQPGVMSSWPCSRVRRPR